MTISELRKARQWFLEVSNGLSPLERYVLFGRYWKGWDDAKNRPNSFKKLHDDWMPMWGEEKLREVEAFALVKLIAILRKKGFPDLHFGP